MASAVKDESDLVSYRHLVAVHQLSITVITDNVPHVWIMDDGTWDNTKVWKNNEFWTN